MDTPHCIIDIGACSRGAITRKISRLLCPLNYGASVSAIQYTTPGGRIKTLPLDQMRPEERAHVHLWACTAPRGPITASAGTPTIRAQEVSHAAR